MMKQEKEKKIERRRTPREMKVSIHLNKPGTEEKVAAWIAEARMHPELHPNFREFKRPMKL